MNLKHAVVAGVSVLAFASALTPSSAVAQAGVTTSPTPRVIASMNQAAGIAAKGLVAAETQVWRTGNVSGARKVAARTINSGPSALVSSATSDKILERAAVLRATITGSGFEISEYAAQETHRVVARMGKSVVEITVVRTWVETDPSTGERTDVGDTDTYRLPLTPTVASQRVSASTIEIAAEGEQTSTEPEATNADVEPASSESETSRPAKSVPEDADVAAGNFRAAAASFNYTTFANYGKKWTAKPYNGDKKKHFNPDYPYFNNNCANFVSQMYNKAGWKRTGGVNPYLDGNWDDNLTGPAGASRTWSQAKELYKYAHNKKGLDPLKNIWNAVPGNTYFMDWDGNSVINHVTAVTGRTSNGIPRISQKTVNRHNMLLTTWKAKVDSSNPKVKWFGLRRTT